jgi:hypothetical protein
MAADTFLATASFNRDASARAKRLSEIGFRILQPKNLVELDDIIGELFPSPSTFSIPIDPGFNDPQGLTAAIAKWGMTASGELFAQQSWPWTIGRAASFVAVDLTDTVGPELQRLYGSPDTGPLACLMVAELTQSRNAQASRSFARNGLVKLSGEMFMKDCQALHNGNPKMTSMAMRFAENLRNLSNDDVKALANSFQPDADAALRAMIVELRSHNGTLDQSAIAAALKKAWDNGIQKMMTAELNRLAAE